MFERCLVYSDRSRVNCSRVVEFSRALNYAGQSQPDSGIDGTLESSLNKASIFNWIQTSKFQVS